MTIKIGDPVIYTFPVKGEKYLSHKYKPGTVVAFFGNRVRLNLEARPGIFIEKTVSLSSIRLDDSRAKSTK